MCGIKLKLTEREHERKNGTRQRYKRDIMEERGYGIKI
jgi:hypothetical protein